MVLSQQLDIIYLLEHWLRPGNILPFSSFLNFKKVYFLDMHDGEVYTVGRLIKRSIYLKGVINVFTLAQKYLIIG